LRRRAAACHCLLCTRHGAATLLFLSPRYRLNVIIAPQVHICLPATCLPPPCHLPPHIPPHLLPALPVFCLSTSILPCKIGIWNHLASALPSSTFPYLHLCSLHFLCLLNIHAIAHLYHLAASRLVLHLSYLPRFAAWPRAELASTSGSYRRSTTRRKTLAFFDVPTSTPRLRAAKADHCWAALEDIPVLKWAITV